MIPLAERILWLIVALFLGVVISVEVEVEVILGRFFCGGVSCSGRFTISWRTATAVETICKSSLCWLLLLDCWLFFSEFSSSFLVHFLFKTSPNNQPKCRLAIPMEKIMTKTIKQQE